MPQVTIISGSPSDRGFVENVEKLLKDFKVSFETYIASAHRHPDKLREIVKESNADVFIGIAGLSAALPGVIASHTLKPVIGMPRDVKVLGIDSLLSIAQMPSGVPVATVGIDNAKNAALLAVEILAIKDEKLKSKLAEYRLNL
ncbi:N5-carboxyaminoimidazole ribonucleotide mutase [archaeon]|nr:N5-carboxyaminoimidazole ribonucleotide mutase [archaeon]